MPETYTVQHNGRAITKQLPAGLTDAQIRAAFAQDLGRGDATVQRQRGMFANPGNRNALSAPPETLESNLSGSIRNALNYIGLDERHGARLANKATGFLNDLTPVGDAVEADQAKRSWQQGNYLGALGHGALAALGSVPYAGDAISGAAKAIIAPAFHGGRAFRGDFDMTQAGSGLGYADEQAIWFTPDRYEANRYAWSVEPSQSYRGKAVYPAAIDDEGFDELPPMAYDPEEFARIIAEARKAGKPGIVFRTVKEDDRLSTPADQIAVLDPSRIKPHFGK